MVNHLRDMFSCLDRGLRKLRELLRVDGNITDGINIFEAVDLPMLIDGDPPALALRNVPVLDARVNSHSAGPHDKTRREELLLVVLHDDDAVFTDFIDFRVQPQVNIPLFEGVPSVFAQFRVERPQDIGRHLHERDVDPIEVEFGIGGGHVVVA